MSYYDSLSVVDLRIVHKARQQKELPTANVCVEASPSVSVQSAYRQDKSRCKQHHVCEILLRALSEVLC